jgi:hypothetical protein
MTTVGGCSLLSAMPQAQGPYFVVCLSTAALWHMKPASAGTFHGSCRNQGHDKEMHCVYGFCMTEHNLILPTGRETVFSLSRAIIL